MKKISLGSFPLVDVRGNERKVFESYLIKVVSDLITVNQISNSVNSDRLRYVTPLSIMNFIKENKTEKIVQTNSEPNGEQNSSERDRKASTIKNAFKNTKLLYQSISNDPFYKSNIFYPIYMEETVKNNFGYSDYNYDFLILSNDLIKQQLLDEIQYDDRITLLFLVLKCLLVPNLRLDQVGLSGIEDGENFRKYFSVFLETCKNENINPFDMFIKIVKAAGKQKRKNVSGMLGIISERITGKISDPEISKKYHSKSFVNLFNTAGEIKDARFLLNIPLSEINAFVHEDPKMDEDYNPMLRQYSQAKTHEYGKILSIIDALRAFNQENQVVTDLSPSQNLTKVQTGGDTLYLNIDSLINELEITYFRRFLEDFKSKELASIESIRRALINKFKVDLYDDGNGQFGPLESKETIGIRIAQVQQSIKAATLEFDTISQKVKRFANALGFSDFSLIEPAMLNQSELNIYNSNAKLLQNSQMKVNKLQQAQMDLTNSLGKAPSESQTVQNIKDKKLSLSVNLEILQSQLTALYSEIYQYFYSEDFKKDVANIKSLNKFDYATLEPILFSGKSSSPYLNQLIITLQDIATTFSEQFTINIHREMDGKFAKLKHNQYDTIIQKEVSDNLSVDVFKKLLVSNIFSPVFIKYSNKAISDSNQLKDLKSTNNPLLRKILSTSGLFKAYILTSDVLVHAYELVHYIDTVKYEEGIINHPVSKVFNDMNKIQFMITRLGLNEHPVYIFHNEKIMLSMPSHLSLTGQNFISTVKTEEFVQFAKINWAQDLWNQNLMFGGPTNSKNYQDLKSSIEKIKDEIKKASDDVKAANDKDRAKKQQILLQKQAELKKKEEKFEEMKKLANGSNLSSNVTPSKRFEDSGHNPFGPRPGGRYDTGMDQNGLNPYERNAIQNGRDQMDGLRNQTNYNQYPNPNYQRPINQMENYGAPRVQQQVPQIQPQQYIPNEDYQENPQNDFMNNPYIQNRMNDLRS